MNGRRKSFPRMHKKAAGGTMTSWRSSAIDVNRRHVSLRSQIWPSFGCMPRQRETSVGRLIVFRLLRFAHQLVYNLRYASIRAGCAPAVREVSSCIVQRPTLSGRPAVRASVRSLGAIRVCRPWHLQTRKFAPLRFVQSPSIPGCIRAIAQSFASFFVPASIVRASSKRHTCPSCSCSQSKSNA